MRFLLLFIINIYCSSLDMGITESYKSDFEKSNSYLSVAEKMFPANSKIIFFQATNHFSLNEKTKCLEYIEKLEKLKEVPEKYKIVAMLMKNDLDMWEDDNLDDITRLMQVVQHKIENKYIGKKVQNKQKEIVDKLDKLIKNLEDVPKKKASDDDEHGGWDTDVVPIPLDKFQLPQDISGDGLVNKLMKMKVQFKNWGELPPAERQQLLQQMTEGLSPEDVAIVESYYRNLAKIKK